MEKPPRYVSCPCQHCNGPIEFDVNEFVEENSIVPCPHCSLETNIFIPTGQTEKVPTEQPSSVASPNTVRREGGVAEMASRFQRKLSQACQQMCRSNNS